MLRPKHDIQNSRGQDLANFVIASVQLADKDVNAATIIHELRRSVQHFPQVRQLFEDVQPSTEAARLRSDAERERQERSSPGFDWGVLAGGILGYLLGSRRQD
jgi:hypothetical protein